MTPERFRKIRARLARRQPDLTVLAENVHKSHNIAAILRTADAVGIHRVHAVSESGEIPRHHMVSGGTRKWVPVELHGDIRSAVQRLGDDGFSVIAAHPGAEARDYRKLDYTRRTAILLGAEMNGISEDARELVDGFVAIPMEGMVTSLNVSVAAALILYEARRQREAAGMYEACRLGDDDYRTTLFEWAYPDLALRCREKNLPYPPLSDDGDLLGNPFDGKP